MLVVTTENVAGFRTKKLLGLCFGIAVRSQDIGSNLTAALRTLRGGDIVELRTMLEEARQEALDRLIENAAAMGANAIVMTRFDSGGYLQTAGDIVAYGTAAFVTNDDGTVPSVLYDAPL